MDSKNNEEEQQPNPTQDGKEEENKENKPPTMGEISITIAVGVVGLALGIQALKLSKKAFRLGKKVVMLGGALSSKLNNHNDIVNKIISMRFYSNVHRLTSLHHQILDVHNTTPPPTSRSNDPQTSRSIVAALEH